MKQDPRNAVALVVARYSAYPSRSGVPRNTSTSPRHDGAVAKVAEIADGVRQVLGLQGLLLVVTDMDGHRRELHLGEKAWPPVTVDLRGVRDILVEAGWPAAQQLHHIIAAGLTHELGPIMLGDDPSDVGVGMLVGWTLGRMGADLDALLHEVEPVLAELDALTPCPSDPPRAPLP